jgi:hypothetical protein
MMENRPEQHVFQKEAANHTAPEIEKSSHGTCFSPEAGRADGARERDIGPPVRWEAYPPPSLTEINPGLQRSARMAPNEHFPEGCATRGFASPSPDASSA